MNTLLDTPDGERHSVPITVAMLVCDLRQQVGTLQRAIDLAHAAEAIVPEVTAPSRRFAEPKGQKSR